MKVFFKILFFQSIVFSSVELLATEIEFENTNSTITLTDESKGKIESWINEQLLVIERVYDLNVSRVSFRILVAPDEDQTVDYYDKANNSVVLGLETINNAIESNDRFVFFHELGHHFFPDHSLDAFYREVLADLFAISLTKNYTGMVNSHIQASNTYCSNISYSRVFSGCTIENLFRHNDTLSLYKTGISVYEFSSVFNSYIYEHKVNEVELVKKLLIELDQGRLANLTFDFSWIDQYMGKKILSQ